MRHGTLPWGLTSKIHALVDAEGHPVSPASDCRSQARPTTVSKPKPCLGHIEDARPCWPTRSMAAMSFGPWPGRIDLGQYPGKRKGFFPFSARVYRQRNLVERLFSRIKQFPGSPPDRAKIPGTSSLPSN